MGDRFVPDVEWEIGVSAAEARYEVVLESLDGAFGLVAAVESGGRQLVVDMFIGHEVFEELGGFVVKAMELGT